MKKNKAIRIFILLLDMLLLLAFVQKTSAQSEDSKENKFLKAFIPDYVRIQFAGQVGMISVGPGWNFLDKKIKTEVFYGYLPVRYSTAEVNTLGIKTSYLPISLKREGFFNKISPYVLASINMTISDGSKTFIKNPNNFPKGYYSPTSIRISPGIGINMTHDLKEGYYIKDLDLYFETVTNNVYLDYLFTNRTVKVNDVFSLAIGVRVGF
ncbi:MAG: hypothetical protein ACEPOV_03775 [Hyphomicrobiales bacterium]